MATPKHFLFGYALEHRVCTELRARGLNARRIGGCSDDPDVVIDSPHGQISVEVKAARKNVVCKPRNKAARWGYRWLLYKAG